MHLVLQVILYNSIIAKLMTGKFSLILVGIIKYSMLAYKSILDLLNIR